MVTSHKIEEVRYVPFPKVQMIADIGWLKAKNVRRDYGTDAELFQIRTMLSTPVGWDKQYGPVAELATDEEVNSLVKQREEDYERLKAMLNEPKLEKVPMMEDGRRVMIDGLEWARAMVACFEWCYFDKKGNIRKPIVLGTTGNRRGSVWLGAITEQLIRYRRQQGDAKIQPKDCPAGTLTPEIFVLVPDFPSKRFPDPAVRALAQFRENELKTAGFKKMTDLERLEGVLNLVENHGKSQSDIRNSIDPKNPGTGIRLYGAANLDIFCRQKAVDQTLGVEERKKWKAIKLIERFLSPRYITPEDEAAGRQNPLWLDFAKFNQLSFQGDDKDNLRIGQMVETESKFNKTNQERERKKLSPLVRPTVEMVEEWIAKQMTEGTRRAPILKRERIQNFADKHPNPFIKVAMKAVETNEEGHLARATARAEVATFVWGCDDKVYEALKTGIAGLVDLEVKDQLKLLKEFVAIVGTEMESAEETTPETEESESGDEGEAEE